MNIFILGATGLIGSAIATRLVADGHSVRALARTSHSFDALKTLNIIPVRGDIRRPDDWIGQLQNSDILIHCAATWDDDMGDVDRRLVDAIISESQNRHSPLRVIYTGGCWLYGATKDDVATETSPRPGFAPFDWMLDGADRVLTAPNISALILHPAMVYDGHTGAFARYGAHAQAGRAIEIWGHAQTRWPLIHADDLARAYALLVTTPDITGHMNASADCGVSADLIARKIAQQSGSQKPYKVLPYKDVIDQFGQGAAGPMLDQHMASPRLRALGWHPDHVFTRS